jgi:hypothetical protein
MGIKILGGILVLLIISTYAFAISGGNGAGNIGGTEPISMLLLGGGLICLAGLGRRILKHSNHR